MQECLGVLVVAYERTTIQHGNDLGQPPVRSALENVSLPTVWNHMEGSMGIALERPLLVLCQPDLQEAGVLEDRYEDWRVLRAELTPALFSDENFIAKFDAWKADLDKRKTSTKAVSVHPDPSLLTIPDLLRTLKGSQVWTVLSSIFTLVAGAAGFGYWLCSTVIKHH